MFFIINFSSTCYDTLFRPGPRGEGRPPQAPEDKGPHLGISAFGHRADFVVAIRVARSFLVQFRKKKEKDEE
jgi:hypothetical protein